MSGKLPAAAGWTGSTKLTVKRLKISTSIHWCATLASSYAAISRGKQILPVFLCVIAGFQKSANSVEEELARRGLRIHVRIAEPLADADMAFSNQNGPFSDADEREKAKQLAKDLAARLDPTHPSGYRSSAR